MDYNQACSSCVKKDPPPDDSRQTLRVTSVQKDPTMLKKVKKSEITAKVILLGESGVGKSSIAHRFCEDKFNEEHDVTIGAAYMQQTVVLPSN